MVELENYAVVVAHPDDEILWFSSILENASKIIICFGPSENEQLNRARKKLKDSFPLKNVVWLEISEANCLLTGSWLAPENTKIGIGLTEKNPKFESNFYELIARLEEELIGFDNVFTHNPWGEYGHEEHTQIFSAIKHLGIYSQKTELKIFVTGYVSERSQRYRGISKETVRNLHIFRVNTQLANELMCYYKKYNAWTWDNHYTWPSTEIFFELDLCQKLDFGECKLITRYPCILIDLRLPQSIREHVRQILYRKVRKYSFFKILRKIYKNDRNS